MPCKLLCQSSLHVIVKQMVIKKWQNMYVMIPKTTVTSKMNFLFVKVFIWFSSSWHTPVLHQIEFIGQAAKPNQLWEGIALAAGLSPFKIEANLKKIIPSSTFVDLVPSQEVESSTCQNCQIYTYHVIIWDEVFIRDVLAWQSIGH